MEELGYKVDSLLLSSHRKVTDLIVYDGPILSHFTNNEQEDFLYYWVDENEKAYRWLIFKIDFSYIKDYLSRNLTLRELILHEKVQYYFIADYTNSQKNTFESVRLIGRKSLSDDYLPDNESYYLFNIPEVYQRLFTSSETSQIEYIKVLRENAIFIKFAETEPLHKHIVSIDGLSGYLDKLTKSYNSYVEESFKKNFVELFTNLIDLNKAIERIAENLQLRVVDAKIASFGIGLSVDTIMLSADYKREVKDWSKTVINDYNNEVLELNYDNEDNLNYVLKNYSPEARKSIFKPILEIYSNPSVEISISKKNLNSVRKVRRPSKRLVKQLTQIQTEQKSGLKEKEFVTIAVEIEKGADLDKIPKKVFSSQPLFERRSDSIELTKPELHFENKVIAFKSPLVLNVIVKNGIHIITANQLDLAIEKEELNDAINLLTSTIYNYWLRFTDKNIPLEQFKPSSTADAVMVAVVELIDVVRENS